MNLVIFFSKGSIEILSCLLFVLLLLSPGVFDECTLPPGIEYVVQSASTFLGIFIIYHQLTPPG